MKPSAKPFLGAGNVVPYSRTDLIRRTLWAMVEVTVFRWSPRFCHGFRARLLRMFGADIPEPSQVRIFPTTRVIFPWKLSLAPHVVIGPCVNLYNLGHITLARGATLSQHAHLCAGTHDYLRWSMPLITAPIVIGENAWLGTDVFVGPGVTIGELAVIGARSVVVKDQPARMVCAGHPCRPLKPRDEPQ